MVPEIPYKIQTDEFQISAFNNKFQRLITCCSMYFKESVALKIFIGTLLILCLCCLYIAISIPIGYLFSWIILKSVVIWSPISIFSGIFLWTPVISISVFWIILPFCECSGEFLFFAYGISIIVYLLLWCIGIPIYFDNLNVYPIVILPFAGVLLLIFVIFCCLLPCLYEIVEFWNKTKKSLDHADKNQSINV